MCDLNGAEDRFYAAWCVDIVVVCFYTGLGKKGGEKSGVARNRTGVARMSHECLVVKALVAHASDPGSIPGDSTFFTSFLS